MGFLKETFVRPKENADAKRVIFVDLAKGICIFLVILLHFSDYVGWNKEIVLIRQIRMPLYFILSGLFYKDYGGIFNLVFRKANKLLIPFLFFYIVGATLVYASGYLMPNPDSAHKGIADIISERFFFNYQTWFLLALFYDNILYYAITKITRDWRKQFLCVVVCAITGYMLGSRYLYFLESALSSMPFFFLGIMLRKTPFLYSNRWNRYYVLIGVIMLALGFVIAFFVQDAYILFVDNTIEGNIFIGYLISILGVAGILILCKKAKWLPFFSYIGRYSIVLLCWHIIVINVVIPILKRFFDISDILVSSIALITVMAVCWLMIPISKRLIPWFIAQKDIIKTK